jgi:hypothetical protein
MNPDKSRRPARSTGSTTMRRVIGAIFGLRYQK